MTTAVKTGKKINAGTTSGAKDTEATARPTEWRDIFGTMTWLTSSLLSAAFAAATAILAKLGISGIDVKLATAVRTSVVVIFTWLLAYATRKPEGLQALSNKAWLFLILSGLATGLSWLCYFHALQVGPASRVAPIDKLSVALVILFGAFFLV